MEKVAIVTDSTCDAAPEELAELGVRCVDLKVMKSPDEAFPDGNSPENIEAFYDYLETCRELPTTAMPSPLEFGELYSELAREGYTYVISLHIASAMSGARSSALMAAETVGIEVAVPETNRNTFPLFLLVRRIAQLRDEGVCFRELVTEAERLCALTDIVFALDTLKFLVKGGRTGRAVGLAASVLNIKPILTVDDDGQVVQLGKAKSMKRALARIADVAVETAQRLGPLEGYFVHARNLEAVDALRKLFEERGVDFSELGVRQVGPVIATHVGCGCAGFAYIPRRA